MGVAQQFPHPATNCCCSLSRGENRVVPMKSRQSAREICATAVTDGDESARRSSSPPPISAGSACRGPREIWPRRASFAHGRQGWGFVDEGGPLRRAAERFQVSHTTAYRWSSRYRNVGAAGMQGGRRPPGCAEEGGLYRVRPGRGIQRQHRRRGAQIPVTARPAGHWGWSTRRPRGAQAVRFGSSTDSHRRTSDS
jgi:Homeodomain-like domain